MKLPELIHREGSPVKVQALITTKGKFPLVKCKIKDSFKNMYVEQGQ